MADVAIPRLDFDTAILEQAGIGVDIEAGVHGLLAACREIEQAVATVAHHIYSLWAQPSNNGVGKECGDGGGGSGCGDQYTVLTGIEGAVDYRKIAEAPWQGHAAHRGGHDGCLRARGRDEARDKEQEYEEWLTHG